MKKMLLRFLISLGLHKVLRPFTKWMIVILASHGFAEEGELELVENDEGRFLRISKLWHQLEYLQAH